MTNLIAYVVEPKNLTPKNDKDKFGIRQPTMLHIITEFVTNNNIHQTKIK